MPLKFKYSLLGLLVVGTATLTTTYWHFGMAGITTFLLAYFSKGMRSNRFQLGAIHQRMKKPLINADERR